MCGRRSRNTVRWVFNEGLVHGTVERDVWPRKEKVSVCKSFEPWDTEIHMSIGCVNNITEGLDFIHKLEDSWTSWTFWWNFMKFVEFHKLHFSKFNEVVVNDFMYFTSQRSWLVKFMKLVKFMWSSKNSKSRCTISSKWRKNQSHGSDNTSQYTVDTFQKWKTTISSIDHDSSD